MATCTKTTAGGGVKSQNLLDSSLNSLRWLSEMKPTNDQTKTEPSPTPSSTKTTAPSGKGKREESDVTVEPVDVNAKPNLSYAELIKEAVTSSSSQRMTLNEIYGWITKKYPYYSNKNANQSWKNSIRHNLSLNRHFVREVRDQNDPGKGSYWRYCENPRITSDDYPNTSGVARPRDRVHGGGSGNHEVPRINPAIQKLYGVTPTTHVVIGDNLPVASPLTPFSVGQQPSPDGSGLSGCAYHCDEGLTDSVKAPSTLEEDYLSLSHGSGCSQLPFAEQDFSASTRELFRQVLETEPTAGRDELVLVSSGGAISLPPSLGSPLLGNSVGSGMFVDIGSPPVLQPVIPVSLEYQMVQQSDDLLRLPNTAPVDQTATKQEPASSSGANLSTIWKNVNVNSDMDKFRDMMGSWQGKDIEDWLSQCNDQLATSCRDFFTKSIGSSSQGAQTSTAFGANSPHPALFSLSEEQRQKLFQQFLAKTQPALALQGVVSPQQSSPGGSADGGATSRSPYAAGGRCSGAPSQASPNGSNLSGGNNPVLGSVMLIGNDHEATNHDEKTMMDCDVADHANTTDDEIDEFDWESLVD